MRKIAHRGFFAQINLPVRSAAPRLPSAAAGPSHSTHQFVCKAAKQHRSRQASWSTEDSYRKRPKSPSREDLGLITPSDAFSSRLSIAESTSEFRTGLKLRITPKTNQYSAFASMLLVRKSTNKRMSASNYLNGS